MHSPTLFKMLVPFLLVCASLSSEHWGLMEGEEILMAPLPTQTNNNKQQSSSETVKESTLSMPNAPSTSPCDQVNIYNLIIEPSEGLMYVDNYVLIISQRETLIRLLDKHPEPRYEILFGKVYSSSASICESGDLTNVFQMKDSGKGWIRFSINLPDMSTGQVSWGLCVVKDNHTCPQSQSLIKIRTVHQAVPDFVSYDRDTVTVEQATTCEKLKKHGSLVLMNLITIRSIVNGGLKLLVDLISKGVWSTLGSSLAFAFIGEFIPQVISMKHALKIAGNSSKVVQLLSWSIGLVLFPFAKLLDYFMKKFGKATSNYSAHVQEIVQRRSMLLLALENKTLQDIMTRIEDVFMLPAETCLDNPTLQRIKTKGFSRIPIYENERKIIKSVLFLRDLAVTSFSVENPLKNQMQLLTTDPKYLKGDTPLNVVLEYFKNESKNDIIFIGNEIPDNTEVSGIVTLHDVLNIMNPANVIT